MEQQTLDNNTDVLIIGGGPAGLMAAEELTSYNCRVLLIDAMPTIGRKFLMAGRSGLNITTVRKNHLKKYGRAKGWIAPMILNYGPENIIDFCKSLGQEIFIGTSERVFPRAMKASPLLRAWLKKLKNNGVNIRTSSRWLGINNTENTKLDSDHLTHKIHSSGQVYSISARATVFAMGGASWPKLGSDGIWAAILKKYFGKSEDFIIPFSASNMGVKVSWSSHMVRFEGSPVKSIALKINDSMEKGEFLITKTGLEGGIVYSFSTAIEDDVKILEVDLLPDISMKNMIKRLSKKSRKISMTNYLRKSLGLKGVKMALFREFAFPYPDSLLDLAKNVKNLKIIIDDFYPLEFAISTKGGLSKKAFDNSLMLNDLPSVFCAGEMLDWSAPTGGYLLTGCFATGSHAGRSVAKFLNLKKL